MSVETDNLMVQLNDFIDAKIKAALKASGIKVDDRTLISNLNGGEVSKMIVDVKKRMEEFRESGGGLAP